MLKNKLGQKISFKKVKWVYHLLHNMVNTTDKFWCCRSFCSKKNALLDSFEREKKYDHSSNNTEVVVFNGALEQLLLNCNEAILILH